MNKEKDLVEEVDDKKGKAELLESFSYVKVLRISKFKYWRVLQLINIYSKKKKKRERERNE